MELNWADDCLALIVADNGHGFRLDDTQVRNHYGIKFMRERIESLNGVFSVQTKEGQGTRIKITLPYEKR